MAAFNRFNDFVEQLAKGTHQLHAAGHTLKVMLTNVAPVATNTVKADLTEISAGNGYTAGGADVQNDIAEVAGVLTMTAVDVVWTASGGTIGPFRYVVLYNDSAASDNLIGWWDIGAAITLQNTKTFTTDFGASVLTLQPAA